MNAKLTCGQDEEFAQSQMTVTIVEEASVAAGASGQAGGFLALDWHGPATTNLAALSYRLHSQLAESYHGQEKWGYRHMDAVSARGRLKDSNGQPRQSPENPILAQSALRNLPPRSQANQALRKNQLVGQGRLDI